MPGIPLIRSLQPHGSASAPGKKSLGKSSSPFSPYFAHCSKPAGVLMYTTMSIGELRKAVSKSADLRGRP